MPMGNTHSNSLVSSRCCQAPFVAGQMDYCMDNTAVFLPVLVGFNPVNMARWAFCREWPALGLSNTSASTITKEDRWIKVKYCSPDLNKYNKYEVSLGLGGIFVWLVDLFFSCFRKHWRLHKRQASVHLERELKEKWKEGIEGKNGVRKMYTTEICAFYLGQAPNIFSRW